MIAKLLGFVAVFAILGVLLGGCQAAPGGGVAAEVNGEAVPARLYDALVMASQRRAEQVGMAIHWDTPEGAKRLTQIQSQTLAQLVRDAVVGQLARDRQVAVSDAELDAAMGRVEKVFGGPTGVEQRLQQDGLSRDDFRTLYRYFLLDQKLRRADPSGYEAALSQALKSARVQAYVGPCASEHEYATCIDQ